MDDLSGTASTASQGLVGYRDFRLRPLVREGELLETVPGLVMTQHSGDGKSNQMFVRGFNLDHGTDFSTRVEGMQVNMPSHGHGQGYTDLNFIIPELVDHVEYELGPYYAEIGDFSAAGGAHLRLRRSLPGPLVSASVGADGWCRTVAAGSGRVGPGTLLGGLEVKGYDGPWDLPQRLVKGAGMLRYSWSRGPSTFSLLALGYDNRWHASDQIPRRLVEDDDLGRFAQVDSTLGGASSRYSVSASWSKSAPSGAAHRVDLYAMRYELQLHSNFTYFLDDPVNGDQIRQEDRRDVVGANVTWLRPLGMHEVTGGVQARMDFADVALRRSEARAVLGTVRADDVTQGTLGVWGQVETRWNGVFRTVVGARGDAYRFDVTSDLDANSGTATDAIVSPKASLIFQPSEGAELYLSGGLAFHSNDARGAVQQVDPASGDAVDPVDPLARSRGAEIGVRASPVEGWRSTLSVWSVGLDSELLFVGDAGTTEPSDASRRVGVTWTNVWRPVSRLTLDADASLARARFTGLPDGEDHVPGALERVVTAGATWGGDGPGAYGALRLRHFGSYPLIEDDAVRANDTSLANLSAGWSFGAFRVEATLLNLFDARAADIQYYYASRLPGEPIAGMDGIHFHPVEPRTLRVGVHWGF